MPFLVKSFEAGLERDQVQAEDQDRLQELVDDWSRDALPGNHLTIVVVDEIEAAQAGLWEAILSPDPGDLPT